MAHFVPGKSSGLSETNWCWR